MFGRSSRLSHDALPGAAARDCGHLGAPTPRGPADFPLPAAVLPDARPRPLRMPPEHHRDAKCFPRAPAQPRCVYPSLEAAGEARLAIYTHISCRMQISGEWNCVLAMNSCSH